MNKKSIRNKTSQPVQKALPAAVHAAAMSLDGETAGAASGPVADHPHSPDVPHDDMAHDGDATAHAEAADVDASAADSADKPVKSAAASRARKSDKPGKAVTYRLTLPANEAQVFDALRDTLQADGAKLKKSVLVRAALLVLAESDEARIAQIIASLQVPVEEKPAAKRKAKK